MNTVIFAFDKIKKKEFIKTLNDSIISKIHILQGKLKNVETPRSIFVRKRFPKLHYTPQYESFFEVELTIKCKMDINCKPFFLKMYKKNNKE